MVGQARRGGHSSFVSEEDWVEKLENEITAKPTDRDAPLKVPHFVHPMNPVFARIMPQQRQQQASPPKEPNGGDTGIAGHDHRGSK